jgi:twitching motility protein PilT
MAALDKLLQLLVDRNMEALMLEPDSRPRMRRSGAEHDASSSPLAAPTIEGLLSQVAPEGVIASAPAPGRAEFDYSANGESFRLTCLRTQAGWSALIVVIREKEDAEPVQVVELETRAPDEITEATETGDDEDPGTTGDVRLITSIGELLRLMLDRGASDLHLSSHQQVRIRVDGSLKPLEEYHAPLPEWLEQLIDDIIPDRNREEYESSHDTDFAYDLDGLARFRVNVFRDRLGMGAVFRVIPNVVPTVEELGLPEILRQVAYRPKGLVLITGPTGSGKTTTLAALIDLINRERSDHIITIEDPIEFIHESKSCLVHQREVGLHTGSVGQGLRAALREDPDVVLVGELRDLETTLIALETAETGHLVFGTLHTTSAASTLDRLIDQFPSDRRAQIRMILSESLHSAVSQTLVKKIGGGRIAAHEVLINSPTISALIRTGKISEIRSAMEEDSAEGSCLLNDSLVQLVEEGLVEPLDAYGQSIEKSDLQDRLHEAGHVLEPRGGSSGAVSA